MNDFRSRLTVVISFAFLVVLNLSSCRNDSAKFPAGSPIEADVLSFDSDSLSDPSEVPKFHYGPRTFKQMTNIENLSGPRFKILQGGDLSIQEAIGTVITSSAFSGYTFPSLEYRVVDGVVKPLTSKSLTMLSASYQFDSLIDKIEALTGKSFNSFFEGFEQFTVLYHPSVQVSKSGEQTRKYEAGNAAYVAGSRQFALFFQGNNERIPMSFNPQILSHEFGHAIFENSFFENKYERCSPAKEDQVKLFPGRLESEFIVRGINEGFADFVSFVWTGSSNILQSSIGESIPTRERDFAKLSFDYDTYAVSDSEVCRGRYYCIGTLWAKVLFDVFQGRSLDAKNSGARQLFLREVFGLLQKTASTLRQNSGERLPMPSQMTRQCLSRDSLDSSSDDGMLAAFFSAIVDNSDPANRGLFCSSIAKNFGISGFPYAARRNCP